MIDLDTDEIIDMVYLLGKEIPSKSREAYEDIHYISLYFTLFLLLGMGLKHDN